MAIHTHFFLQMTGQMMATGSPNPNMMVAMNSPLAQGYGQQPPMGGGPPNI